MEAALFWVGAALVLCAVALIVAAIVTWNAARRIEPNEKLQTALRELDRDLADLSDHIVRKENRERTRKMRDGREAAAATPAEPAPGTPEHKQFLRSVARERGLVR